MHFGFRADGGPEQGFGHLIRTRTLARELLARGHAVTYLTATPESVRSVSADEAAVVPLPADEADDPKAVSTAALESGVDVLVVDRGAVPLEVQRTLSDALLFALILDGEGSTVHCDLVVNGHLYADVAEYDHEGDEPIWCVGSDYYLLDRAFRRLTKRQVAWNDPPQRALIAMGGSDVANTTPTAVRAFNGTDLDVDVIVGPGFENHAEIDTAVAETAANFEVVEDPDDLPERMFRADLAVTALGLTTYELLAMRTPFVGIPQAPDQYPKVRPLREREAALVLDGEYDPADLSEAVSRLLEDSKLRRTFFERGREIVGGDGTGTVCDRLEELA